jgi:Tn3 transposase DDE domain
MMTRALHKLRADSVQIEPQAVAALSPYIRSHISRFGQYTLDLTRMPPPIDYDLLVLGPTDGPDQFTTTAAADD